MYYRILFILFAMASNAVGFSQTTRPITISGRVCDTDSIPLARVSVRCESSAVFTNKNGIFVLSTRVFPATITCTHTGYEKKEITITEKEISSIKNDTLYLPIVLIQITVELPSVQITDRKAERAYDKPRILILDYDFYKDRLILLLKENKKYKLRLTDENSNTLFDLPLKNNPVKLFRDCYNNLHVLGTEYGFQFYCTDTGIFTVDTISTALVSELLLPCVGSSETHLFFKHYGRHNQSITYFSVDASTRQKQLVHRVDDTESALFVDYFYRKTMANAGMVNMVMAEDIASQNKARDVEKDIWFYEKTLSRPVYNPFLPVRDSFFVFNHVRDSMFVFSKNGMWQRGVPIDYHYKNGWKQEILIDRINNAIYARCLRGGLVYLLEINATTGKTGAEYKLEEHAFPENIKMRNGYAYYLYATNDYNVTNVYRQKLK
ncbi:MAG: hypothetical protein ACHQF2_06015 [Flavobacteriales bacterium]